MKVSTPKLSDLLRAAVLHDVLRAIAAKYAISPDAVLVLLALVELHAKGQPSPNVNLVCAQLLYAPSLVTEAISQLHKAELLIRDSDKVAATDKAAKLFNAVHEKCEQELEYRANTITRFSVDSRPIREEKEAYCEPIGISPLFALSLTATAGGLR